jgi:hypothetical protein
MDYHVQKHKKSGLEMLSSASESMFHDKMLTCRVVSVGHTCAAVSKRRILNINVGIMGHVDSGKTSLARALSTTISTAALVSSTRPSLRLLCKIFSSQVFLPCSQDKNPQSQERGITLDLGFSSFIVPLPEHLKDAPYDDLQFTVRPCVQTTIVSRTLTSVVAFSSGNKIW